MNPLLFRLFRDYETKVHELNYLFWECTTRCMLRCRHCGSDCSVQSREKDMPLEDFLRALDTIPADHRPRDFSVVLTGGEPLLRPDIAEAGREIRRRGFIMNAVTQVIVLLRTHLAFHTRLDVVIIYVLPYDRYTVGTDDAKERLILVTPWFWNDERDIHVRLLCHAASQSVTRCTQTT